MQLKKKYTVLTFRTTSEAMHLESVCRTRGIPGRLIPVPREISAGCGLAWRMECADYVRYQGQLEACEQAVKILL